MRREFLAKRVERRAGESGLTLFELLLVIALLSSATALLAPNFASASEAQRRRAVLAELATLDARARVFARSGEPVSLVLDRELPGARVVGRQSGARLGELRVSDDVALALRDPHGTTLRSVAFDAAGRSADYVLLASDRQGDARLAIAGATGWVQLQGEWP